LVANVGLVDALAGSCALVATSAELMYGKELKLRFFAKRKLRSGERQPCNCLHVKLNEAADEMYAL
jgi:hypothetical protein